MHIFVEKVFEKDKLFKLFVEQIDTNATVKAKIEKQEGKCFHRTK